LAKECYLLATAARFVELQSRDTQKAIGIVAAKAKFLWANSQIGTA